MDVSPDRRSAYEPAAAFIGAPLAGAALIFGKYVPQAEGTLLRFGERDLVIRAAGGAWLTTLDDSHRPGNWLGQPSEG